MLLCSNANCYPCERGAKYERRAWPTERTYTESLLVSGSARTYVSILMPDVAGTPGIRISIT
jgi:hypothetical protein